MSGVVKVLKQCLEEDCRITATVVEERARYSTWGCAVLDRPAALPELHDRLEIELRNARDYDFARKRV